MADEIESFFKSKKKVAAKKVGAQTPDILGRRLEQAVQEQENFDITEEEWKQNNLDRAVELLNEGDSEWIEEDENPEFNLPGLKDLDTENASVDNEDDEPGEGGLSKQKAWKVGEDEENVEKIVDQPIVEAPTEVKSKAYVPPALKAHLATRVAKEVNLTSADEFPSLSDADDICKAEMDKKKIMPKSSTNPPQINPWMPSPQQSSSKFSSDGNKVADDGIYLPKYSTQPPSREEPKAPNRYVPPHLRK